MLELQLRKKIELVEQEIHALWVDDPTMYYEGDFDELWEARRDLVSHLARFHPERPGTCVAKQAALPARSP